ncbi:MAG: hypothetical protein WBL06_04790 [Pseudolysinimonas sp.]|uniref:hypothetical protein n=1 Tax=Pseudolysinimonas sp. TaxID=2680009 RepID=UPI003C75CEE2
MTWRPILALATIALVLAGLAVAATLRQIIPQLTLAEFDGGDPTDQIAVEAYYDWLNSGWVYYQQAPWLATGALIAAVAALALAAYRAQRRIEDQAGSASARASRETARS